METQNDILAGWTFDPARYEGATPDWHLTPFERLPGVVATHVTERDRSREGRANRCLAFDAQYLAALCQSQAAEIGRLKGALVTWVEMVGDALEYMATLDGDAARIAREALERGKP